jgi:glucose/arabinose dehydrogenase
MMNNPDGSGLHFGGRLAFDPRDGSLLLSIGDRRNMGRVQNGRDHAGSIVRMTIDGDPAPGNPFLNDSEKDDHIYAMGLRNVQGMAFAPESHQLWVNNHGPQHGDMFPEWRGALLHGGLEVRALVRTRMANGRVVAEEWMLRDRDRRIRDVRIHRDGSVWLLTEHEDGEVLRVSRA